MEDLNIIGAEVYAVLNNIPKEMYNKVPNKILDVFKKFEEESSKVKLKDNIPFEEQNISKKAKDIIFAISLNYWLTEEERKKVLMKLKGNEETLNEKYNNIFKKVSQESINTESKNMIKKQEEKWYIKILNKIKNLFKRK